MSERVVTLANESELVNFEVGKAVVFPCDYSCSRTSTGQYVVTYINRGLGTFTISSVDREALSSALGKAVPALDKLSPLSAGIAASVALAGLGWVIARRNAVAASEREDSGSWAASVVEWFVALVRGLCGEAHA